MLFCGLAIWFWWLSMSPYSLLSKPPPHVSKVPDCCLIAQQLYLSSFSASINPASYHKLLFYLNMSRSPQKHKLPLLLLLFLICFLNLSASPETQLLIMQVHSVHCLSLLPWLISWHPFTPQTPLASICHIQHSLKQFVLL